MTKKCKYCKGQGVIICQTGYTENDFVVNDCDICNGTGEVD